MNITTKQIRLAKLDQFYTKENIATQCIQSLLRFYPWDYWDLIIEPSAGNGSFYCQINSSKKIGMDIEPKHPEIIECDFFTYQTQEKGKILVLGNPPFGKICSQAVKFFQYASQWCDCIAFIVPRTFRRVSIQNKLNLQFHLIHDEDIPTEPCSFYPPMLVKCCFQIWKKQEITRNKTILSRTHPDWTFLYSPTNADFAIRAYGGNCGEIKTQNLHLLNPKSWHWMKSNIPLSLLIERFQKLNYHISTQTARQNSIGRADLVSLYSQTHTQNPD